MNKLLTYGSTESIPYYNCSGKSDEEWYATGVKRPLFGWTILIFGSIVVALYMPTLYMIFKTKLVRHSCYKIIVLLGIIDMCASAVCSIISGVLFIKGAVYCSYPTFIYVSGSIGITCWCCACASTLLLVVNRVGDVIYRPLNDFIFHGKRAFFSISLIVVYGFCICMFTPAILFNSQIMAWIANPLVIDNPTPEILDEYRNNVQTNNNWVFVTGTCSLYLVYCVLVNKMQKGEKSVASKQVFIQASIICSFNTFSAMAYNAMLLIPTPPWVVCIGELCWSIVHGCPAIIYLTMNKTIRYEFLSTFGLKKRTRVGEVSYVTNPNQTTNNLLSFSKSYI